MDHYLPIFFDGLSEEKYPFNMLAQYAIYDLISASGEKVKDFFLNIMDNETKLVFYRLSQ